jgi:ribulose-phosphate 3-epimerase
MTVHPGFSGQTFLPGMMEKLAHLSKERRELGLTYTLAVDGGITLENAQELIKLGADQLAVASALFNAPDLKSALLAFKKIL